MARTIARLTANDLLSPPFIDPGTHWVDDGLYLQVAGPKSRSWIFRYTLKGKTRWAGLGSAESVTLAEAKLKRDVERVKVKRGTDPVAERKLQQENERKAKEPKKSFRQCFEAYLADNHAN
jgi:hypothetical protein